MIEANVRGQAKKLNQLLKEIDEIEGMSMDNSPKITAKCRAILNDEQYWEYQ